MAMIDQNLVLITGNQGDMTADVAPTASGGQVNWPVVNLGAKSPRLGTGTQMFFIVQVTKAFTSGGAFGNANKMDIVLEQSSGGGGEFTSVAEIARLSIDSTEKAKKGTRLIHAFNPGDGQHDGTNGMWFRARADETGNITAGTVIGYLTSEKPRDYVADADAISNP